VKYLEGCGCPQSFVELLVKITRSCRQQQLHATDPPAQVLPLVLTRHTQLFLFRQYLRGQDKADSGPYCIKLPFKCLV
jgi:hypothetical protein